MKAIRVRYIGPTQTRPARLKADDGCGNSVTISVGEIEPIDVALALCDKMGWRGELTGGTYKDVDYFVFIEQSLASG